MSDQKEPKIVHLWPHQRAQVLEVPGLRSPTGKVWGAVFLTSTQWAHFVDLHLGAGFFKLEANATPERIRLHALRALASAWNGFYSLEAGFSNESVAEGYAFVIRLDPRIENPKLVPA